MVADYAMSEANLAIDEIVDPLSAEDFDFFLLFGLRQISNVLVISQQCWSNDFVEVSLKATLPFAQGP